MLVIPLHVCTYSKLFSSNSAAVDSEHSQNTSCPEINMSLQILKTEALKVEVHKNFPRIYADGMFDLITDSGKLACRIQRTQQMPWPEASNGSVEELALNRVCKNLKILIGMSS